MVERVFGEGKKFGGGGPGDKRKLEIGKGRKRSSEHHPERQWLGSTLCYGEWGDVDVL